MIFVYGQAHGVMAETRRKKKDEYNIKISYFLGALSRKMMNATLLFRADGRDDTR